MNLFVNISRVRALVAAALLISSGTAFAKDIKVTLSGGEENPTGNHVRVRNWHHRYQAG